MKIKITVKEMKTTIVDNNFLGRTLEPAPT